MGESIFLLNNDGRLIEMNESGYITEDHLQVLLAQYPNLIPGSQIDPGLPRRWLLISREFGVPDELNTGNRWSLDHLLIDQDGVPTLVEIKRSTDNRIRREVIGQILDYAANAVSYWSVDEIKYRLEERCKDQSKDMSEELGLLLGSDGSADMFWERVKTNLKAGKIRMLIVADTIPKELQRIIEFLNGQMTPAEILGVEIKQFVNDSLKTLVPRVLGQTAASENTKGKILRSEGSWDEASFMEQLSRKTDETAITVARQLIKWAEGKSANIKFGNGSSTGSIQVFFRNNSGWIPCFILYSYGVVEMQFQYMRTLPFSDEAKRREFIDRINTAVPGANISIEKINKRPPISLSKLYDSSVLAGFLSVFDWYYNEIRDQLK